MHTTPLSNWIGVFFIKRIISILLSILLCVCLVSCSNSDSSGANESTISAVSEEQGATENESGTASSNNDTSTTNNESSSQQNNEQSNSGNSGNGSSSGNSGSGQGNANQSPSQTTTKQAPTQTTIKQTTQPSTSSNITCSIKIECSSILSNMDKLKAGHESYVPSNGVILSSTSYTLKNGSTAYDLLSTACSSNGIYLNVTNSSYGKYVAGINNLDEKDCGNSSGWMYMVNGSYPSMSCDKKVLSNGDSIVFTYTCG